MRRLDYERYAFLLVLVGCLFYTPTVHAELHGGIEIGGFGIKATVLDVNGEGENIEIKTKLTDTTNTALTAGIAKDGQFNPADLEATAKAVKKYYDRFQMEFKIPPERIYIVGSSGLFAAISKKDELIAANKKVLSMLIADKVGPTMAFITVKQESELSIAGTLPKSRRAKGILVDIGSGNTKGGIQIDKDKYSVFGIPFGTVTFAQFAKEHDALSAKSIAKLGMEEITPLLKKELDTLPEMAKRDSVYLSGGIVWAVTTFVHPLDVKSYTPLTLKDIEAFEVKLTAQPGFPEIDLTNAADTQRDRAMAELAKVKKVYTPERILAGLQILKAVYRQLESENRQFYFARHGNLGWLLAYVSESATKQPSKP